MHFLLNLLRIKGLCMFRALLAYPQEALNKGHLVYCVRVMSAGCTKFGVEHNTHAMHGIPNAACEAPHEDDEVMLETYRNS
jgi:hypothetical protein